MLQQYIQTPTATFDDHFAQSGKMIELEMEMDKYLKELGYGA